MQDTILTFGRFRIDLARNELWSDRELISLPPLVFRLLSYLALNRMRTVSQEEILSEVWGGVAVGHSAVAQALKQARHSVADSGREQKVIKTVRGFGYRFVAEVRESSGLAESRDWVFVGHATLLEECDALLDRAISGHGGLVLLSGEAGLGKTRVTEEIAKQAMLRDVLAVRGAAIAQAGMPPYWPWIGVFRNLSVARPIHELSEEIRQFAPRLLDPSLASGPAINAIFDDSTRFRIFDSVNRCLRRASEISPLLLILDDLHDAGASTLELLEFIAGDLRSTPILIVAAYRRAEALRSEGVAAVLGRLRSLAATTSRTLVPLEVDDTIRLVENRFGSDIPSALVELLAERSGGNPFYALEIARFLQAELRSGSVTGGGYTIGDRLPRSIQHFMTERLATLSPRTRRIIRGAAALGGRVEFALLAEINSIPEASAAIDEACVAGILVEADSDRRNFVFSHELIREALYQELSSGDEQRRRAHLRIAETLLRRGAGNLIEIAFHLTVAAPLGGVARTVDYLRRAGGHAKSVFDDERSWLLYQQALRLMERWGVDDDALRFDILLTAGEMAIRGARVEQGRGEVGEAIEIARRCALPKLFCRAVLAYSYRAEIVGTSEGEIVELLEEAIELLGGAEPAMRARLLSRLAIEVRYHADRGLERALRYVDDAIATARVARDASALARTLEDASVVRWSGEDPEGWIELNREIVRAATQAGDRNLVFLGIKGLATGYMEIGDPLAMAREMASCDAIAAEWPSHYHRGVSASLRGARAFMAGRFDEGEACAIEVMGTGIPGLTPLASVQLYYHRLELGRLGELEAATRSLAASLPGVKGWGFAVVRLLESMGRIEEARAEIESIGPIDDLPRDRNWLPAMALYAEALSTLEDPAAARVQFARLRPYARINVVLGNGSLFYGNVSYFLGRLATTLGRWAEAKRMFDSAESMHERLQARPWLVRTGIARASLASARGDREGALELVEFWAPEAEAMGMVALAKRAGAIQALS